MDKLEYGLYEALLDEYLHGLLAQHPELKTVLGKIETEEQPSKYASFVAKVLEQALREETDPELRLLLCNKILENIAGDNNRTHLRKHRLVRDESSVLLEITPPNYNISGIPRPHTPLAESSLFTGSPREPQLAHELIQEMRSADEVNILVSFIKWSGLRLLMPGFEDLCSRNIPVRVITTSYMGASDSPAIEWLAGLPNVRIRISYDTERTRLHAKAYHFKRNTGYTTAYIGSANMSHSAITSGLEWNLKVTASDMMHIIEKFSIEFETYWNSREFIPFNRDDPTMFREAIKRARNNQGNKPYIFFDLQPHPFQERILEALERERSVHNRWKNLVIAATGTGKTVVAAFDFKRFFEKKNKQARLLFVAHRQQILQQAQATFRNVLRDNNFGELLVGNFQATRLEHLFCSVNMLANRRLWEQVGKNFYDYIVIDEVHHGTADSYRPIFENFSPEILLGLTATPERMDGGNVAADFGNRFAAEIRLPEALDEKLLCPFHYFGVADPIAINQDKFWRKGKYDASALENVYVIDTTLAEKRINTIISALHHYEPDIANVKGIGFCITIKHAEFMAEKFTKSGIPAGAFVSGVDSNRSQELLSNLQCGQLKFLFTVDRLSEGIDIPEINTVLFLRPTDSLTVFLQQLGRGLRHSPGKEALTVLDFVGQVHRNYHIELKFRSLLPRYRFSMEKEVDLEFPHLPAGCSIQLDRVSREYVLKNIRDSVRNLATQIPDKLSTFKNETGQDPTFGNFIDYYGFEPEVLLAKETWSGWKAKANLTSAPKGPDIQRLKAALIRATFINGPMETKLLKDVLDNILKGDINNAIKLSGSYLGLFYYRLWGDKGESLGFTSVEHSYRQLAKNPSIISDLIEIINWSINSKLSSGIIPDLSFNFLFELHSQYGIKEIQACVGRANIKTAGQTGVGVLHFPEYKTYAILITFQKTEKEFSPSTMYADYPISRRLLHWESQSTTSQLSETGQNFIHHKNRRYTILIFARSQKKINKITAPFVYLGPADIVSYESERPIKIIWDLKHEMPVEMFEDNRKG